MENIMNGIETIAKFGSELVTGGDGVDTGAIQSHAEELVNQYGADGLIVVTSGAVASGRLRVEQWGDDVESYDLVTLAQLGSASIMKAWENAFDAIGVKAGGLLTTHHEIDDSTEGPSLLHALRLAADARVTSIVNENDALSNVELMKLYTGGENDGLAAHVAIATKCKRLRLFTKSGGIRDDNERHIDRIDDENYFTTYRMLHRRAHMHNKKAGNGRGGAHVKVKWAKRAANRGVEVEILRPLSQGHDQQITRVVVG